MKPTRVIYEKSPTGQGYVAVTKITSEKSDKGAKVTITNLKKKGSKSISYTLKGKESNLETVKDVPVEVGNTIYKGGKSYNVTTGTRVDPTTKKSISQTQLRKEALVDFSRDGKYEMKVSEAGMGVPKQVWYSIHEAPYKPHLAPAEVRTKEIPVQRTLRADRGFVEYQQVRGQGMTEAVFPETYRPKSFVVSSYSGRDGWGSQDIVNIDKGGVKGFFTYQKNMLIDTYKGEEQKAGKVVRGTTNLFLDPEARFTAIDSAPTYRKIPKDITAGVIYGVERQPIKTGAIFASSAFAPYVGAKVGLAKVAVAFPITTRVVSGVASMAYGAGIVFRLASADKLWFELGRIGATEVVPALAGLSLGKSLSSETMYRATTRARKTTPNLERRALKNFEKIFKRGKGVQTTDYGRVLKPTYTKKGEQILFTRGKVSRTWQGDFSMRATKVGRVTRGVLRGKSQVITFTRRGAGDITVKYYTPKGRLVDTKVISSSKKWMDLKGFKAFQKGTYKQTGKEIISFDKDSQKIYLKTGKRGFFGQDSSKGYRFKTEIIGGKETQRLWQKDIAGFERYAIKTSKGVATHTVRGKVDYAYQPKYKPSQSGVKGFRGKLYGEMTKIATREASLKRLDLFSIRKTKTGTDMVYTYYRGKFRPVAGTFTKIKQGVGGMFKGKSGHVSLAPQLQIARPTIKSPIPMFTRTGGAGVQPPISGMEMEMVLSQAPKTFKGLALPIILASKQTKRALPTYGTDIVSKTDSRTRTNVSSTIKSSIGETPIIISFVNTKSVSRVDTLLRPTTKTTTKTSVALEHITQPTQLPAMKPTSGSFQFSPEIIKPPPPPVSLLRFGYTQKKRKTRKRKKKQSAWESRYTPDITAVMFKQYGKKPTQYEIGAGLARPMIKRMRR